MKMINEEETHLPAGKGRDDTDLPTGNRVRKQIFLLRKDLSTLCFIGSDL